MAPPLVPSGQPRRRAEKIACGYFYDANLLKTTSLFLSLPAIKAVRQLLRPKQFLSRDAAAEQKLEQLL